MSSIRLNVALALGLALGTLGNPCVRADAPREPTQPVELNIPSQPLGEALNQFAAQAHLQIMVDSALSDGHTAQALAGTFRPREALERLLSQTRLGFVFVDERTIALVPAAPQTNTRFGSAGNLRLAQAERISSDSAEPPPATGPTRDTLPSPADARVNLPEVLVTAGRILNMDIARTRDDAQPYMIFDRETIERSGAPNLEIFFKQRLTMNAQAFSPDAAPGASLLNNLIDLRGLGSNQTLILIDGHRMASSTTTAGAGFGQPAIKGIPIQAIERIEVLPTTASGIYGGSATGGAINIIMRRDYNGSEVKLTYDNSFDSDSAVRRVDFNTALNLERSKTSLLVSGSYSDGNVLASGDRDFVSRGRQRLLTNDPAFYLGTTAAPPVGHTVNVRNVNGSQNLTLDSGVTLGSPRTFVPVGYAGPASDGGQALLGNAGQYNFELADTFNSARQALLANPTVAALNATIRQEITPRLQAFIDAGLSEHTGYFRTNASETTFTLPGAAPNNPFLEDVYVSVPMVGTPANELKLKASDRRVVAGMIVGLPQDWHAAADYTWQRRYRQPFTSASILDPTLAAAAAASGVFDPLRDPNVFPIDGSAYRSPPSELSSVATSIRDYSLRFSGPVTRLPAGPIVLSSLLEYRNEVLGEQQTTSAFSPTVTLVSFSPRKSQSVRSAYVELRTPLVSSLNVLPLIKELELQLAARRDEYTIRGGNATITSFNGVPAAPITHVTNETSSTDLTLGVRYTPVQGLMLRGSYGTGFLPPGVTQLLSNPRNPNSLATATIDPRRGNTIIGGMIATVSGGNPDLTPEQSKSWSAGFVVVPTFVDGLRVSVDYTQIEKTDNIQLLSVQQVINNEAFLPGRVIREASCPGDPHAPVCRITEVNATLANIARAKVKAYDLQLDYRLPMLERGSLDLFVASTWQPHLQLQLRPDAPLVEVAGINALNSVPVKFKTAGGLTWSDGPWTVGWSANHFSHYRVADPSIASNAPTIQRQGNGGRVPSQIYHDAFVSWSASGAASSWPWLADMRFQLGIRNVFNKEPPVDVTNTDQFYSFLGDPRLRSYAVSVSRAF